jgi:hypothetical protein
VSNASCWTSDEDDESEPLDASLDEIEDPHGELAPEARAAAARLGQRHRDAELVDRLARSGFVGLEYDTFVNDLVRYGLGVMTAWVHTGEAYRRASRLGRPVDLENRPRPPVDPEDAAAIAHLAVTRGLKLFREKGLQERGWRPDGGASLRTYFIRSCLLTFSRASEGWQPDLPDRRLLAYDVFERIPTQRISEIPEQIVVLRAVIAELFRDEKRESVIIMRLRNGGYTDAEIASILPGDITAKAVEHKAARARKRLIQRKHDEEG